MSFSKIIKQKNILLVPFSWMYKAGAYFYHSLYNLKILKSVKPSVPTICVGNLSVGGTGKSPMTELLVSLLKDKFRVAIVSRGYKRKTKGFYIAQAKSTANEIGDEPMQFRTKFPDITVAVGEQRVDAIQQLMNEQPQTEVVILDDALQHRAVDAGLNILLTEYSNLFVNDWYLPAGSLRDLKSNYKRADLIVVTKCPPDISETDQTAIRKLINPSISQKIFFAAYGYSDLKNIVTTESRSLDGELSVLLVTGIANPNPLLSYLKLRKVTFQHTRYNDHHHFTKQDIEEIISSYNAINSSNKIILTTEKDAMRLCSWEQLLSIPVFAIPVQHQFLFGGENEFNKIVLKYVFKESKWLA